jgi:hypothetical protein
MEVAHSSDMFVYIHHITWNQNPEASLLFILVLCIQLQYFSNEVTVCNLIEASHFGCTELNKYYLQSVPVHSENCVNGM